MPAGRRAQRFARGRVFLAFGAGGAPSCCRAGPRAQRFARAVGKACRVRLLGRRFVPAAPGWAVCPALRAVGGSACRVRPPGRAPSACRAGRAARSALRARPCVCGVRRPVWARWLLCWAVCLGLATSVGPRAQRFAWSGVRLAASACWAEHPGLAAPGWAVCPALRAVGGSACRVRPPGRAPSACRAGRVTRGSSCGQGPRRCARRFARAGACAYSVRRRGPSACRAGRAACPVLRMGPCVCGVRRPVWARWLLCWAVCLGLATSVGPRAQRFASSGVRLAASACWAEHPGLAAPGWAVCPALRAGGGSACRVRPPGRALSACRVGRVTRGASCGQEPRVRPALRAGRGEACRIRLLGRVFVAFRRRGCAQLLPRWAAPSALRAVGG